MRIKWAFTISILVVLSAVRTSAQEYVRDTNECASLQNAVPVDLVQFLNGVTPDARNGDCVTWAIRKLGAEKHDAAIPALVRLLDFRRPLTPREKMGYYLRMQGIWEIYPAAGALPLFGKKALPAVLEVITSDSGSAAARENAIFVWMAIHRQSDEHPKGVSLLRQEEIKTKDSAIKQRLKEAVQRAVAWCNPPEEAACRQAATTGE